MERKVIVTADGSSTIHISEWNEQYHSKHGAIQEAMHVFIKNGLTLFRNKEIKILEIGFGTALNCFITYFEAKKLDLKINYIGVEAYPVSKDEIKKLNYASELNADNNSELFEKLHDLKWEVKTNISNDFSLLKEQKFFQDIQYEGEFDLIYFDAFGARVQPELWTEEIFEKMFNSLRNGGVLVTYSAKGSVRRAMQTVGFKVERLPGPPGKREMLRATKQ